MLRSSRCLHGLCYSFVHHPTLMHARHHVLAYILLGRQHPGSSSDPGIETPGRRPAHKERRGIFRIRSRAGDISISWDYKKIHDNNNRGACFLQDESCVPFTFACVIPSPNPAGSHVSRSATVMLQAECGIPTDFKVGKLSFALAGRNRTALASKACVGVVMYAWNGWGPLHGKPWPHMVPIC